MEQVTISVIMPTYNTPQNILDVAIQSVLCQTYKDFEFIIIDDCSTDTTGEYLKSLSDERIRIITNKKNLGITKSLNIGLHNAKGKYIARMDSDDFALPERFEKQLLFMEENPNVIVCGTWIQAFGSADYTSKRKIPENEYHRCSFLFGNIYGLCHPTAFFRGDLIRKYNIFYNEDLPTAQDYGMWVQCVNYGQISNVPEILLKYRVHSAQISISKKEIQESCAQMVQKSLLSPLLGALDDKTVKHHFFICKGPHISKETVYWFKYLKSANRKNKIYNETIFDRVANDFLKCKVRNSAATTKSIKDLFKLLIVTPLSMDWIVWETILIRICRKRRRINKNNHES